MTCNNCCKYFRFVNSATIIDGKLVLTLNTTTTFDRLCFRFANNIAIPSGASALPVVITIGTIKYPLLTKLGDSLLGKDLIPNSTNINYCPRYVYKTYVGTAQIVVHNIPRNVIYCGN